MATAEAPTGDDIDAPFIPSVWIGKNKNYSGDLPIAVIAAKNAAFELSTEGQAMIPPGKLAVIEFADLVLPRASSELVYGESQLWFSKDEPATDISLLKHRSIPPTHILDLLSRKSGQAWLNGAKSIADPRFNDGADRFPLETLTFWKEMSAVIQDQAGWKRSIQWLNNERRKSKDDETTRAIDSAQAELETMGWNAPLTYGRQSISTLDLREFLSTVWLRSNNIDIMMEDLAERVASDPELADKVIVAPLAFSNAVLGSRKGGYSKEKSPLLDRYEREIREKKKEMIVFPANVENNHWIAGVIGFSKQTIDFGDSMPGCFQPPTTLITALQRWLLQRFGDQFHCDYDGLEHGVQRDGYSCGIVMGNTCERALYPSTPLWIPRRAVHARLQHFLKHAKNQFTSSGGDFTDWDNASGSGFGFDEFASPAVEESEAGSSMDVTGPGLASEEILANESDAPMDVDTDAQSPSTASKSQKPTNQSSLLGFFSRIAPKKAPSKASSNNPGPSSSKKRGRSKADDGASVGSKLSTKKPKTDRTTTPPNVGISRTSKATQSLMRKLRSGKLEFDQERWDNFKDNCRKHDKRAEFMGDKEWQDMRQVRHSTCGSLVKVRHPYEVSRFKSHCEDPRGCKRVKVDAGMSSLPKIFTGTPNSSKIQHSSARTGAHGAPDKPCPGVTEEDISNVQRYLRRTGATGGGSRSVFKIAKEKFKKAYSALTKGRQKEVRDTQYHEQKWRNDHANLRIFSTSCEKTVPAATPRPLPCPPCTALLPRKSFRRALRKKGPAKPENYIFTNQQFRNQVLGELYARIIGLKDIIEHPDAKTTPCIRYAQGVLSGKYNNEVFNGLVEAMVTKTDRDERGVGMQNFKYAPAYDEFCNVLRINSPAAYRAFREHRPGRDERSFRAKQAREPRFPMDISDRNFKLAAEHLQALNYDGPVNLSCDDTKLFPSFRLYWDNDKKSHFLVGATDGPLRVADPDQVKGIRLWCLTIPVPGVTPIIVAALPIANDLKANVLLQYLNQVVNGLIDHNINIISYACDGTQTERTVQDMFVEQASEKIEHLIKDPRGKGKPLHIKIAVIRNHSICMIQDSKHALKTFRNNLFSGARLLVLGSYTAIYSRIREMAFADGSPLFHRDVEKMDRQDDNAATRLFSADTLKYLADHHPEYLGEIVYLFIFGELIDAYQNRSISHAERVKLVLRARYFLDSWRSFLDLAEYPETVYCLSREALDIARFIIEGYLSLLYVHRDHLDGIFPLLPWLHSSEACEHIFGEARHIVKDFTMLNFLYMIPKLRVKLRAAMLRAKSSNPKDRAAGYSHTYFDTTGLDILALSAFPSDDTIDEIASEAAEESDSLIALLGLAPSQLLRADDLEERKLPSIAAWYGHVKDSDADSDTGSISEAQQLQDLMEKAEDDTVSRTRAEAQELLTLTSASLALSADDMMKIHSLPDADEIPEILDEIVAEEQTAIPAAVNNLPAVSISEATKPLGEGSATPEHLNFDYLVELRRRHQTIQAARGVRTRVINSANPDVAKELSLRQQLIRKFHLALKEESEQDQAIGTGLVRSSRWRSSAPGGRGGNIPGTKPDTLPAGNSANAAVTATALAKKVISLIRSVHRLFKLLLTSHTGSH
ncbi:hypothetical protein B0H13DRAFT_1616161 [Mycena leptocephala]|nr:hypothetical protein B0H13DRAFT_1616161 [Mycena leptocephala]